MHSEILKAEIICGIYKITSPSNKVYVGKSINIYSRWNSYRTSNCINQVRLYKSLKKHTPEKHLFEIIYVCNSLELDFYEQKYIVEFDCLGVKGLNSLYKGKFNTLKKIEKEKLEKKKLYNKEYSKKKDK